MPKQAKKTRIFGTTEKPRLVVYKSLKYTYAQIVDDSKDKTIFGASDLTKEVKANAKKAKSKMDASKLVGEFIAKKAVEKKIKKVVFDRNGYKYHGRVKALAEGARKGGLEF